MNTQAIARALPNTIFDRKVLFSAVEATGQQMKESSAFWLIRQMIQEGLIFRVGRGKYMVNRAKRPLRSYDYTFSDGLQKIVSSIEEQYPLVEFQSWETAQYNYFVRHLIAHNVYFIEVEKMLENTVFDYLRTYWKGMVLVKPDMRTCMTYADGETIIVQKMISEAPVSSHNPHGVPIEKLLVDMLADKKVGIWIEEAEFPAIWEDIFSRYVVDETKMFRYARRRNAEDKVRHFILTKTDIQLHEEGRND